jgi:hypothetical protein
MSELVKVPLPDPFVVIPSDMVGLWLVLQQTPREVTVVPPSEVISPPLWAIEAVILVRSAIVTVGTVLVVSFLQLNKKDKKIAARNILQIINLNFKGYNFNFFIFRFYW